MLAGRVLGLSIGLSLAVGSAAVPALAQQTPRALSGRYSPYEEEAVVAAEQQLGMSRDPSPEGKLVEGIVLAGLDPIEARDPVPTALNVLHFRSRDAVIERELVFARGAAFSHALCQESARRLRALPQLSLVLCVALRGSAADRVKVLVLTKDVWSLYPDFDLKSADRYLKLQPLESNLLGLHHVALLRYQAQRGSHAFGADYRIPRLDGRFISLIADANVFVSRETGEPEGSYGAVQAIGLPRSDRDPWSWFADFNWRREVERRYQGEQLEQVDGIPLRWDRVEQQGTLALTRSFGWRYKTDVTAALGATRREERLPLAGAERISKELAQARIEVAARNLRRANKRLGPTLEAHLYTSDFLSTYELETLGLQEDFRLGHALLLRLSPALSFEPDARMLVAVSATAQETFALGNGLVRLGAQASGDVLGAKLRDPLLSSWLRIATPRLGFGRLVQDTLLTLPLDGSEAHEVLRYGNGNRLRGYRDDPLDTRGALVSNLEYRTPALELWTEQVGAVLFYDAAAARNHAGELVLLDAVGVGLRVVTPIIERVGFSVDVGFPLRRRGFDEDDPRPPAAWYALRFGQAFGVKDSEPLRPGSVK